MTMPKYTPPSGAEDFAAQAEQVQRDRAQLEQEMVLAAERRAQRPPAEPAPPLYQQTEAHLTAAAGAVIDPDGQEFERDADGFALEDRGGSPIPRGEYERDADGIALLDGDRNPILPGDYERDEDGTVLLNEGGFPYPLWQHDTIDYKGMKVQIRAATPEALNALSLATSESLPVETRNRINRQFVDNHISQLSQVQIMDGLMAGTFTMDDYGEIMKRIARRGTARPTKPSKR